MLLHYQCHPNAVPVTHVIFLVGDDNHSVRRLQSLDWHEQRVWSVSWNHAGTILASCGEDKSLCLWAFEGFTLKYACSSTESHSKSTRHVSWSPCGNYIATASFDATVTIWRVAKSDGVLDLQSIAILEGHANEVKCVEWASSGRLLATCGRDKSVWVWEFDEEEDFQCVSVLQPHSADVKSVFWHPIKEILGSTSYDKSINLYKEELEDWTVACKLVGHDSTVWKAAFSPSGNWLASVSEDKTIRLWHELPSGTSSLRWVHFKTISDIHTAPIYDLDWSSCGHYLATCGGDDLLCILRICVPANSPIESASESSVTTWQSIPRAHKGDINSVAWRPKHETADPPSAQLATGGDDRLINIWSIPLDSDCIESFLSPKSVYDDVD